MKTIMELNTEQRSLSSQRKIPIYNQTQNQHSSDANFNKLKRRLYIEHSQDQLVLMTTSPKRIHRL